MNNNWIKQLSKTYIQLNEAKANIRGEFPFLMRHETSDMDPSESAGLKREDLTVAAGRALGDKDHFIHNSKYEKMKTALSNHVAGNTQQEDLEHIVRFMQMDQRYSEMSAMHPWDRKKRNPR
jgi:hypothetical protein